MHGPTSSLSSWLLVLLCAVSGAYCLRRVRAADGGVAAAEAVMGLGMAAMAVPVGAGRPLSLVLAGVFGAAALHAVWLLRRGPHHAHHLVGSLAMLYMAATALSGQGHGHAQGLPLVTGALLLYYAGYVLLGGARLITAGGPAGRAAPPVAADPVPAGAGELTRACRLAMGIGMLAMLLAM
ncbi:DUF5134 domain-containing protein [Streptomyces sp. NPDC090022]|uniref:DUF5134 domain-containing protein n=1 Tax=Streptomyces sp. NPDC090022 TaxID=3365920 RepID=UPI0037F94213